MASWVTTHAATFVTAVAAFHLVVVDPRLSVRFSSTDASPALSKGSFGIAHITGGVASSASIS